MGLPCVRIEDLSRLGGVLQRGQAYAVGTLWEITMIAFTAAAKRLGLGPTGAGGAERLGRRLAAMYRIWSVRGIDLVALATCLLEPLGGVRQPIGEACLAVAAAVAKWGGRPYHSVLHHAEVAVNASVLTALGPPLSQRHRGLLLAAALGHDYLYHPGGSRFAAEMAAADAVDAIAADCDVPPPDRADLCRLILATEPSFRPVLREADIASPSAVPAALRNLHSDPELAQVAGILSDADVLSSAALTHPWKRVQRARLERELGRAIPDSEDFAFLNHIAGPAFVSAGGQYFTPNLRHIRAAACAETLDHG